jgi:tetratricopeptide (TPR) repeat protein
MTPPGGNSAGTNLRPGRTAGRPAGGLLAAVVSAWLATGCGGKPPAPSRPDTGTPARASAAATKGMREQLLAGVVTILSSLDRYDPARGGEQIFDRLMQWSHAAGEDGRGDASATATAALIDALPQRLQEAGRPIAERGTFDAAGDVAAIRDRCWLAAIAETARGDAGDQLAVAERLFAWTVRSLAAVSDPPMVPGETVPGSRWFLPGEILLAGRASGPQRAWIFLELLRQAGIDGVVLATPTADGGLRPWLPAAIVGGEAYLFEPTYGMPVPGPAGSGVATARQAAADPTVLEALSLPNRRYPVQASDLADGLAVLVAADPWSLAARMVPLDRELAAAHGIRAAAETTAVVERAENSLPKVAAPAGLWPFPWETVARRSLATESLRDELGPLEMPVPTAAGDAADFRPLFVGRVREFRGDLEGRSGAKAAYLAARPSRRMITAAVEGLPEPQAAAVTRALVRMKEDATYWLGLVLLNEGEFAAAADYLGRMTLEAAPDSRWTDAARVNLAATLAGLGRNAEAAGLLRQDGSPQRFGSRLRADRLEAAADRPEAVGKDRPQAEAETADSQ